MKQRLCICDKCKGYSVKHHKTGVLVNGQYLSRRQWARHQEVQQEANAIAQTRNVVDATALRTITSIDSDAAYDTGENGEVLGLPTLYVLPLTCSSDVSAQDIVVPPTLPETSTKATDEVIRQSKQDIWHLKCTVDERVNSFAWPAQLKFRSSPSNGSTYTTEFTLTYPSNRGSCGLFPKKHADTARLCHFEDWLIDVYLTASDIDTHSDCSIVTKIRTLKDDVISALRRIDELKSREWQRQQKVPAHLGDNIRGPQNSVLVDSSKLVISCFDVLYLIVTFQVNIVLIHCRRKLKSFP
jgi:hypothetical protein